jgi:hypothetical protein
MVPPFSAEFLNQPFQAPRIASVNDNKKVAPVYRLRIKNASLDEPCKVLMVNSSIDQRRRFCVCQHQRKLVALVRAFQAVS